MAESSSATLSVSVVFPVCFFLLTTEARLGHATRYGGASPSDREREYLLAEFSQSFQHMGKLDDRRFQILQFYSSFITAVVAAVVAILGSGALGGRFRFLGAAAVLSASVIVSWTMGRVLASERRATERYRNKINAIRKALLSEGCSSAVGELLELGHAISIGLEPVPEKQLLFRDLFDPEKRCTALYIKVLIDCGMAASAVGAVAFAAAALLAA